MLSVVMPYYRNPGMLQRQYSVWAGDWPADLRQQLEIVIVDDGSPDECALDVLRPVGLPAIRIFKVLEDRPWHQHGARNLGAREAAGDWLLMTDMDHIVPAATINQVLRQMARNRRCHMTFARVDAPTDPHWLSDDFPDMKPTTRADGSLKPHPNSFVLRRDDYLRIGGYDEDYCGIYGTDGMFRKRLERALPRHHVLSPLIRVPREVVGDASTRDVQRKDGRSPNAKHKVLMRKRAEGRTKAITFCAFPWERQL